jgi:hypothetical protein
MTNAASKEASFTVIENFAKGFSPLSPKQVITLPTVPNLLGLAFSYYLNPHKPLSEEEDTPRFNFHVLPRTNPFEINNKVLNGQKNQQLPSTSSPLG